MRKISKIFLGFLASTLLVATSYAGELAVTGGATATYAINGDDQSSGKSLGISNEIDLTANGELDNGMTWKYQVQLDGATTSNDDTRLEIGTDKGTIGLYVSEGGMSSELAHGVGAMGVGFDYVSPTTFKTSQDVDGYSNIQYHTVPGLLPLATQIKLGYVPNMGASTMLSAKDSTGVYNGNVGRSMEMIQIKMAPIDGLAVQGSISTTDADGGTDSATADGTGANVGFKFTEGAYTIGATHGGVQPAIASGEVTYYTNTYYGAQYDVNDALSLSFNRDKSVKTTRESVINNSGATTGTKANVEMEQDSFQVAYTTGGATIGWTTVKVDNADYTDNREEKQSVLSLGISF